MICEAKFWQSNDYNYQDDLSELFIGFKLLYATHRYSCKHVNVYIYVNRTFVSLPIYKKNPPAFY